MKKVVILSLSIIMFSSCILRHTDDLTYLGEKYCFVPDGRSSVIGYNTAEKSENMSLYKLTDPKVVNYAYNDIYIIAKSVSPYDKSVNFWIIDKTKKVRENVTKYDSIAFYDELIKRKINLKLKNSPK